ncbi:hypothetical protein KUCAC02_001974 [Chaenocephalus aceratus]|uniref:Uncharacterized protein n=1 Tax=Chaenocephalus aceratus TaxID=36190 RepID=A0ACB9XTL0_CHAAC|nr:hypothetical protein KUCAC02_001974 [Chaenocephalus aceratus]
MTTPSTFTKQIENLRCSGPVFAKCNQITSRNLEADFFEALDQHTPHFIQLFKSKKGSVGQKLQSINWPTSDVTEQRSVVLKGIPIVFGDDSKDFFKTCFDTTRDEALSSVTVGVLTVLSEDSPQEGPSTMQLEPISTDIALKSLALNNVPVKMGQTLCICSRGSITIDNKKYYFVQKLDEGGFSYVDLLEGAKDGRFYALKKILCHDREGRQEAQTEMEMHQIFNHPNILSIVAHTFVDRGSKTEAWLLLPYIGKGSLWSVLEKLRDKGSLMSEKQILQIFRGICSGLKAMHEKGYAHRDLKPTNVLLDEDDRPLLMDLGSMNRARIEVRGTREAMTIQDWAAQRCTISYRAPELFNVESHCIIDERTDIWSLGCVLYCMMMLEGPYDMVFQKGDSVALAVQNPVTIPQSCSYSGSLKMLLSSIMMSNPQERPNIHWVLDQVQDLQSCSPNTQTNMV